MASGSASNPMRPSKSELMDSKNVVMASHGRAPWYGPDGKNIEAYVVGIAGGSASGKVRTRFSSYQSRETYLITC